MLEIWCMLVGDQSMEHSPIRVTSGAPDLISMDVIKLAGGNLPPRSKNQLEETSVMLKIGTVST